jgi:hypothetical protein
MTCHQKDIFNYHLKYKRKFIDVSLEDIGLKLKAILFQLDHNLQSLLKMVFHKVFY